MELGASERKPVVLIVDDNPTLLDSIEQLLSFEGFEVLAALHGQAALDLLRAANPLPELIISDVMMPVMDGFELFEAVRNCPEWVDIPFLFLTARDEFVDLERAYNLGADDYLGKPFDHNRLVLIVRSKIKRRREWKAHLTTQQAALDRAKRDLAMLVAHELRTPLVSITMVSDILAREITLLDPEQVGIMLNTMQGGSARLNRLVEQMVMYVQLESGALTSTLRVGQRPIVLHDLVIGGVERARRFAYRRADVPVRFEEFGSGLWVSGDAIALQHALAEVLANAMSFSPDGQAVMVRLWSGNGMAWFCASDYGPGMSQEEAARAFEPFYQVNRAYYEQQGIGIGLTLARGIIEAHDGVIELQSSQGHGTEVRVGLPLYEPGVR